MQNVNIINRRRAIVGSNIMQTIDLKSITFNENTPDYQINTQLGVPDDEPIVSRLAGVEITKEELNYLEINERKNIRAFIERAKTVGTVNAIENYLSQVNQDQARDIVHRFGQLHTES